MRTALDFVQLWARAVALVVALIPPAQAMTSQQLGFRQLGTTSANVDVVRLRNQLCDILGTIQAINGHRQACALPCEGSAHQAEDRCREPDTYDLAPSKRLLFEIGDARRQALLDFVRLSGLFCEHYTAASDPNSILGDLKGLEACWQDIPGKLEALRTSAESLYAMAADADGGGTDDTSRVARAEGARAVAAIAALGQSWGWQQAQSQSEVKGTEIPPISSCRPSGAGRTIPKELVDAIHQMAQISVYPKLQRAKEYFPELRDAIEGVRDVLAAATPTAAQMDTLCRFSSAVDVRTNARLERLVTVPGSAGAAKDKAQLLQDHHTRACRNHLPADGRGLCPIAPGEYAISFADYLRGSFRTWNKANAVVKDTLPKIRSQLAGRLDEDIAALDPEQRRTLQPSMLAANLMAKAIVAVKPNDDTAIAVADDEARALFSLLLTRLEAVATDDNQAGQNRACAALAVRSVITNADQLANELKALIDSAANANKDAPSAQAWADFAKNARQWLRRAFAEDDLAAIKNAADQLAKLGDRITIAELSDSGAGLVLEATLQRACAHDGKVDIELAFRLAPKPVETTKVQEGAVVGVALAVQLRRSLLVSLDAFEFQSKVLDGTLEAALHDFIKENLPNDFAADASELCALPAALADASSRQTSCAWPSALQLPVRARIIFDANIPAVTIKLPDWLESILPESCPRSITIGNNADGAGRLDCFGQALGKPALEAMLGQQFARLRADAKAKIDAQLTAPLVHLLGQEAVRNNPACRPSISITLTDDSYALAAIHRSILAVDLPEPDEKHKEEPQTILKIAASLAFDTCLRSNPTLPQRLRGLWWGTALQWTRILKVNLPRSGGLGGTSGPPSDPLDAWVNGLSAVVPNADTAMFVWEQSHTEPTDIDRKLAASLLLLSDHLELCKAPDGQGEELAFHFSAISENGGFAAEPCTATGSAANTPPLVIARGEDFRSLRPSAELENAVIGPVAGRLTGAVALHLQDLLEFGTMPNLSDEAKSCSVHALAANRLSFAIDQGSIDTASVDPLPRLHLVVGWETGQPASLAFFSDEDSIPPIASLIATATHFPASAVKVKGFAVTKDGVKPCVTAPTPTTLAARLGPAFAAELLSSDAANKLGSAARDRDRLTTLLSFIRNEQPRDEYERVRKASSDLLLQLRSCAGRKDGDRYLTCDYTIAIDGCPVSLRIDRAADNFVGPMRFYGRRLSIPAGCAPSALGILFGSSAAADLPFAITEPALEIGDTVSFNANLMWLPTDSSRAAVNACLAAPTPEQKRNKFEIKVDSSGAITIDRSALDPLARCAKEYAIGKAADAILPPSNRPDLLEDRVNDRIRTWLVDTNAAMTKACKSLTIGPLRCNVLTVGEAVRAFPSDWGTVKNGICKAVAAPIDSALLYSDEKGNFKAQDQCLRMLSDEVCRRDPASPICTADAGFQFELNLDLPGGEKATAKAHYLPPDRFVHDSCFQGREFNRGYLHIKVDASCEHELVGFTGTVSFSNDVLRNAAGQPFPIVAPITLRANLKTGSVFVDAKAPRWTAVLSEVLSHNIRGESLVAGGMGIEATDARVDDNGVATIDGTVSVELGENRIAAPGFRLTVNLLSLGDFRVQPPDVEKATRSLFERQFAQLLTIPGVLKIVPRNPVYEGGKFKSISATATVETKMFTATLPPVTFDRSGAHLVPPASIGLAFKAEIPIPPLSLTRISGTISQKFLSLGADATFGQAAMAYLLKATGTFTLPFDLTHEDITAVEQMVAFSVVPLGKSTSVINVNKPLLSRTIDVGGALKPILWLHGKAELDKAKLSGDAQLSVFGVDLSQSMLDVDFGSGRVSALGGAKLGIGRLDYAFNSRQFTRDARLGMNGEIAVGKFSLSGFNILATMSSAAVKFRALGISLGFVAPGLKDINSDMLLKLLEKLLRFDLRDLGKALEAILSGNLTINPFSHFGKDQGNGVADASGSGSEGGSPDGASGPENGGGETGGVPGAAVDAAKQTPRGQPADPEVYRQASESAAQTREELQEKAKSTSVAPGASKPLLNPEGKYVMQFKLATNGSGETIVGELVEAGQDSVAPLLVLSKGDEPKSFFKRHIANSNQLSISPTPVLLARGLFVASEASRALFLPTPSASRNAEDSPIKDLCKGAASEVDFLLFPMNVRADQPKRLAAGLLGLCLEGLNNLETRADAKDLLEAGLRVAAEALPDSSVGTAVNGASIQGPLKSAWFQCQDPSGGAFSGLGLLIDGELASRVVLKRPDKTLSYLRMSGFPYGMGEDGPKERRAACLLLAKSKSTQDGQPFDLVTFRETGPDLIAGRTPSGEELKFDRSTWEQIGADQSFGVPPLIFPIDPAQDEHDKEIRQAIQEHNDDLKSNSKESSEYPPRVFVPGGHSLCVVQQDGQTRLAVAGSPPSSFMKIDGSAFAFKGGSGKQYDFPGLAAQGTPADCVISNDPARLVIYDPDKTPAIGRLMVQDGGCALDLFWQEGTTGVHAGFELTRSLCAAAQSKTTEQVIFGHDMFWVISPFMHCMDHAAPKASCVPPPLMVGGGWTTRNRVVMAAAPSGQGAYVWADRIQLQSRPGRKLQGNQEALNNLIRREWKPVEVDTFAEWFQSNRMDLRLIHSNSQEMSFMRAGSSEGTASVLRINFGVTAGTPGPTTAIDFISAPGVLSEKTLASVLEQDSAIPASQSRVEVALISSNKDGLTFAVQRPSSDGQDRRWDLYRNGTQIRTVLVGRLLPQDLVPGLGAALDSLAGVEGEIRIAHNANAMLVANGGNAWVADRGTGTCVEPLLKTDVQESVRKRIVDLWLRDLERAPLKLTRPCGDAAIDATVRFVPPDGHDVTFVEYPAGVLARLPASHVLASDRSMTVIRQMEVSANFADAENQAVAFGLRQAADRLDLLGQIGKDRLRFALGQKVGLAGPQFACPFTDAEKFAQPSVVLNEYLASIGQQCEDADGHLGTDIQFRQVGTSHGVVDVVIAPDGRNKAGWSVFFGDGKGDREHVQSAHVIFQSPESALDSGYLDELVALARAWIEFHTQIGRDRKVTVTEHGDEKPVAVAAADDGTFAFAATLKGRAAHFFWLLGGGAPSLDPFVGLNASVAAAAAAQLTSDLETLSARRPTPTLRDSFCVIHTAGGVLWPSLLLEITRPLADGQSFQQRYSTLGAASTSATFAVVAGAAPPCDMMRSVTREVYRDTLRAVLVVSRDSKESEVWLGTDDTGGARAYARYGVVPCTLRSRLNEIDTFDALNERPEALDCPANVFKKVLGAGSGASPRLILTDRDTGGAATVWVESLGAFKAIGLIDPVQNYSDTHWKLLKESDLSSDVNGMALALAWKNGSADTLTIAPPGSEIVTRSFGAKECEPGTCQVKERRIQTLGFPEGKENCAAQSALKANGQNCPVLVALRTWASQDGDPDGLVFLSDLKQRFWILDSAKSARLFEPGSMGSYAVSLEANNMDVNALMRALRDAREPLLAAIKERGSTLRIKDALVLIGEKRLIVQTPGDSKGVRTAVYDEKPELGLIDRMIAALASDATGCVIGGNPIDGNPCRLLAHQQHFALIDGAQATLGSVDAERLGQASVSRREGADIAALITRMLEVADSSQLALTGSVIIPMGNGQGVLANKEARRALFFNGHNGREIALRPALSSREPDRFAQAFAFEDGRPDFVARLMALKGVLSLGLSSRDDWFACADRFVTIVERSDRGRVATITASAGSIEPFCAAVEKSSFALDDESDGSLMMLHGRNYLLSKAVSAGGFKLRVWGPSLTGRGAIVLPFDPASVPKPSLEHDILDAAIDCRDVEKVARDGAGIAVLGHVVEAGWECSMGFDDGAGNHKAADIDRPTLFIKQQTPGGTLVLAGTDLPSGTVAPRSSEILGDIATLAAAKFGDRDPIMVQARQDPRATDLPFILETTVPKLPVSEKNAGSAKPIKIVGWLPQPDGPVQTIAGSVPEIDLLWEALGSRIAKLSGAAALRLGAFAKGAGAVLFDELERSITVAPDAPGVTPVTRGEDAVAIKIAETCAKKVTSDECSNITPDDMAKAALKAIQEPDGGRRIAYDNDRKMIIWPDNVWTFWKGINGDRHP